MLEGYRIYDADAHVMMSPRMWADLPEEYRMAVVLFDLEGLPYADIAELMEVPVGTVKSRLFWGRMQLQNVLYDYAVGMGYIAARTETDE